MQVRYTIAEIGTCDYIVDFEFHKELDAEIVFDGGWDIVLIKDWDNPDEYIQPNVEHDEVIKEWLKKNEWRIYVKARKECS